MENKRIQTILTPYNPWWLEDNEWQQSLPAYERPVVRSIIDDLEQVGQVISVTGPRRVGKSTALMQVISRLIKDKRIDSSRILYFSFDDPEVFASQQTQKVIFDSLMKRVKRSGDRFYFFLDEIQRLPRWELFIKKYYDLKYPVRFVISGSASSPIFRSSRESLLGRVNAHHLLSFSFREYCQYKMLDRPEFSQILETHKDLKPSLLAGNVMSASELINKFHNDIQPFDSDISQAMIDYCREGGFPEVWALPDSVRKIEYLMEQQVRKVLYEDLVMLTRYRKPENVLRFFVYLLAHPGNEINTVKVAQESGVERRVVEDNLPRLEMTDLIVRIQKFRKQALRVRHGNIKCYPLDLALKNAVLKTWTVPDQMTMGLYAENLVVRELITWPEAVEVSYFREKNREVDFILTYAGNQHLPIEVKHRKNAEQTAWLGHFMKLYKSRLGILITNQFQPSVGNVLYLPLRYFLLAT